MEFGTFWPPEVTHYFGDKHTHDSDHAECFGEKGLDVKRRWRHAVECGEWFIPSPADKEFGERRKCPSEVRNGTSAKRIWKI